VDSGPPRTRLGGLLRASSVVWVGLGMGERLGAPSMPWCVTHHGAMAAAASERCHSCCLIALMPIALSLRA